MDLFKAQLAYHYGWTDKEIGSMSYHEALKYWLCITSIEAQRSLVNLKVASYPHITKNSEKTKLFNELKKKAFELPLKQKSMTVKDRAMQLARMFRGGR